ncbi:MAG: methionyl-tRNA formyltransferase [Bacteroidales bacterium]|nr:methionyl-tRNA formyltransferase [Bacteroidales bacterium]
MKKLDQYLLKSFVGPFALVFFIVLFILVMQFLWVYIDELVGKGLGFAVIAEFMGWGACTILPMVLPLSTLLASIMTMGGLGENNELLAMKAAGISLGRTMLPLMVVSLLITGGAFLISNEVIPVAYEHIYALHDDIGRTKDEIKIPNGVFYDGIEGYTLRVESQDEETGMMHNLMVYDHTDNIGNKSLILAESGRIQITEDKKYLIFDMYNGRSYDETNRFAFRDTTLDQDIVSFKEQRIYISLANYTFTRDENGDRFSDEIMSQDLHDLRHDRDSILGDFDFNYETMLRKFVYNLNLEYYSQIDTSVQKEPLPLFDIKGMRQYIDSTLTSDQKQAVLIKAKTEFENGGLDAVSTYERDSFRYLSPTRKMLVEMCRKFTLALACLLFFFIGAPLGAIIRKGGLGTPVIISILFFVFYWVIDTSGVKLARDGNMNEVWGAFISSAALLPIGVFLTWQATTDSPIFTAETWKTFLRKVWAPVAAFFRRASNFLRRKKGRIDIVYMGTPEFAVEPLKALMEQTDYNIAAVVTVPDKASGRGLQVHESAVKKFAVEHGIPVLQPEKLKDPDFLAQLKSYDPDLFIVVAFRMLPKEVWSMPRLGTFNLHASILPQYRGAAPINWAIINGEKQTGVTTFMIDEKIDTGGILYNDYCPIEIYDNVGTLHDKLAEKGSALVVKTATALVKKKVTPSPQVAFSELKPAPKITRETCQIDLDEDAAAICLLIRGLSPYPGAHLNLVSEDGTVTDVKVYDAFVPDREEQLPKGQLATDGKSYLSVGCANGNIRIMDIQLAGKKRLKIEEFLKGFRDASKYHFE